MTRRPTRAEQARITAAENRAARQAEHLATIAGAPNLEAALAATLTAYHANAPTAPVGGGFLNTDRARDAARFIAAALAETGWTTTP